MPDLLYTKLMYLYIECFEQLNPDLLMIYHSRCILSLVKLS